MTTTEHYDLEFWHCEHERPYRVDRIVATGARDAVSQARRLLGRRARRAFSPPEAVQGWNLGDREGCDDAILVHRRGYWATEETR